MSAYLVFPWFIFQMAFPFSSCAQLLSNLCKPHVARLTSLRFLAHAATWLLDIFSGYFIIFHSLFSFLNCTLIIITWVSHFPCFLDIKNNFLSRKLHFIPHLIPLLFNVFISELEILRAHLYFLIWEAAIRLTTDN